MNIGITILVVLSVINLAQLLIQGRERYEALMAEPARIEETLLEGAAKARGWATPFLARIRDAVGIRGLA